MPPPKKSKNPNRLSSQLAARKSSATKAPPAIDPTEDAGGGAKQTFNATDMILAGDKARELMTLEDRLEVIMGEAEQVNEKIKELKTITIPELMDSIGLADFKLRDGENVHVKPLIRASLPAPGSIRKEKDADKRATMADRYERGLKLLEKYGAASLIKQEVSAVLGKDSDALAKKVLAKLKELGVEATADKSVNANSLTSYIKERIKDGNPVDMDVFAVFNGKVAEVERPKTSSSPVESSAGKKHTAGKDNDLF